MVELLGQKAKRCTEDGFGMKLSQKFDEDRKIFWKEVTRVRKKCRVRRYK